MKDATFNIAFTVNDKHYEGWATPSKHTKDNGLPKSFHVVLNRVMFGNVSHNDTEWTVDEDRPEELTHAIGKAIEAHY